MAFSGMQDRPKAKSPADSQQRLTMFNVTRQIQLAGNVEVAASGRKRSKGLLGRKGLAPGEALWIVPCEAVHTFGMRFALDLVYLDRRHRIRKIQRNVPPWRLSACLSAHSVVELAAGSIRETDAQPGDQVELTEDPAAHAPTGSARS